MAKHSAQQLPRLQHVPQNSNCTWKKKQKICGVVDRKAIQAKPLIKQSRLVYGRDDQSPAPHPALEQSSSTLSSIDFTRPLLGSAQMHSFVPFK